MKRLWHMMIACTMTLSLLTCSISQASASDDNTPTGLTAQGAVLLDMQSHQILFDQNKDAKLFPASITKIMTALLALEKGNLTDMVTTSQLAREQEGNRIYLETGERQPLEKLLYGLMLNSGNDAAVAIAEHLGGTVEGFAKMMNDRAASLGATNTHFVTPNGLHDEAHYTTPYDMALITEEAMKLPKFREIVTTKTMPWHGQVWESELYNINPLLWDYEGSTGVKTGFTDQAQQTMVATATRNGREVLAVLMGVVNRPMMYDESTKLLDYGLDSFQNQTVVHAGDVITAYDDQGAKVAAKINEDVFTTYAVGTTPKIEKQPHLALPPAPYPKGSKVGTVDIVADGKKIATSDLLAGRDVFPPPTPLEQVTSPGILVWLLPLAVVLLFGALLFARRRRQSVRQTRTAIKYD